MHEVVKFATPLGATLVVSEERLQDSVVVWVGVGVGVSVETGVCVGVGVRVGVTATEFIVILAGGALDKTFSLN